MPNRYPAWKYILLVTVVVFAIIYALPNAYPEDPTLEISGDGAAVNDGTLERVDAFWRSKMSRIKRWRLPTLANC